MTLQEAKDQIAFKYGFQNWTLLDYYQIAEVRNMTEEQVWNEIAELYARSKWDEACRRQGQIIFTMCADFHTTGSAPKPEFKP